MKLSQSIASTQSDANGGWLSGWWGWYGESEDTQGTSLPPEVVNELPQTAGIYIEDDGIFLDCTF